MKKFKDLRLGDKVFKIRKKEGILEKNVHGEYIPKIEAIKIKHLFFGQDVIKINAKQDYQGRTSFLVNPETKGLPEKSYISDGDFIVVVEEKLIKKLVRDLVVKEIELSEKKIIEYKREKEEYIRLIRQTYWDYIN